MKIDEKAEREAFEAVYGDDFIERRGTCEWAAWLARAAQPVRVKREALLKALKDECNYRAGMDNYIDAVLRAIGIEVIDA